MAEEKSNKSSKKKQEGNLRSAMAVIRYIKPYKWYFVGGMVVLMISSLSTLLFPYFFGGIIDVAGGRETRFMTDLDQTALILLVILGIQALASYLRIVLFARFTEPAIADMRKDVFTRIVQLPVPFIENQRSGELVSRITDDISQLGIMISSALAEFLRQMVTLIGGVIFLLYLSPKLTLVMLSTFPIIALSAGFIGRWVKKFSKKRQDALAEANNVVSESIQNILVVKAFNNERYERNRYGGFIGSVVKLALRLAHFRGLLSAFIAIGVFGGMVLVLWFGARLIADGSISPGQVVSFIMYTLFIGATIAGIGDLYTRILSGLGASERIRNILKEDVEDVHAEDQTIKINDIKFEEVMFNYPSRPEVGVLKGIDLKIKAGEKIALVGQSGSGKSTIANLLLGFYNINKGMIAVNDRSIDEYELGVLRRISGIVPQDVILFGGTIGENIGYGKPGATNEEIQRAAEQANAVEFIDKFPDKMDTIVGERGIKLSGGQKQRIAIARAILKDPELLILDEATSSLDSESEKLVQDALETLMENRTTLIIAHRLGTIRNVNRIYVMDQGEIVEQGSYQDLASKENGAFSQLLKLQLQSSEQ